MLISQAFGCSDSWLTFATPLVLGLLCGTITLTLVLIARERLRQASLWNLPGPPSVSIITGNFTQMFSYDAHSFHHHIRRTYGRVIRVTGFLGETHLLISDCKAITSMLEREYGAFDNPEWLMASNRRNYGPGLIGMSGAHHRKQRKLLNPVFSTQNMRSLTPLFCKVTRQLETTLQRLVFDGPQEINLLMWLERLSLELIAQGGLGYTFDSLKPDRKEDEFEMAIKEYMPTVASLHAFRTLAHLVPNWPPSLLRFLGKLLPIPMLHKLMKISAVIDKNMTAIFDEKKALLDGADAEFTHQLGEGKDLISVLMRQNLTASEEDRLPEAEIKGQMASFVFAATGGTSSAVARVLLLLSEHQDVQDRLRQEIYEAQQVSGEDELEHDKLDKLPLLEAVCKETLRVYPPAVYIPKFCREDITIPLAHPVQTSDGLTSSLFVPRGTNVLVNAAGQNLDPSVWGADAEEWKPDRFLSPLPGSVMEMHVPGIYPNILTFGAGARACIGYKFAVLETKVAVMHVVRSFRLSPAKTEVVWRFGGISTPSTQGSNEVGASMPLVLERI
ncbi:cytochrome P450 [Artomyces pyxidatus]|uniref:Cytochrome P450 n=1 Tax=Artomyces pyxidatus TaxID=48021 RepID=A0ACB8SSS3_9AGAM|nr:cytochrome P450 [Artomyces pyxidatus]